MMLESHNLAPFRQEKALPVIPAGSQNTGTKPLSVSRSCLTLLLYLHSEKQKGAEGGSVLKPKIILNFQYRLLEKKK